ncbi:MAG: DegT/DnrJ/EryC1/StrS aminotransferase family protein [Methanomicrobiales archaeon]|nr:DegT/DnrJ/EryC1/StrS aminotransferase family protein [Methanomicrobiales archaeon]
MTIRIPIARPCIGPEEVEAVRRVMESGNLAQGEAVAAFEREFAAFSRVKHAVAVNNGTAALHAALLAAGIGPGDEVIAPSFTFIATATSVSMCGAVPRCVDVDDRSFNLDPEAVERAVTPATRAVVGVHLFGQLCDVAALSGICEDHDLAFIEDAAQAHGATFRGLPAGSFGEMGCFSFYATKNMTTGEGGMVTTDSDDLAATLRLLVNHGQSRKYLHTRLGYNYRMTDMAAAMGLVQLRRLPALNAARGEHARYLDGHLRREGILTPRRKAGFSHVYHQYVIQVMPEFPLARDRLAAYLGEKGIGTAVHYPMPIHLQPLYGGIPPGGPCPVSERLAGTVLSLPVHPGVSGEDLAFIAETVNGV